MLRRYLSVFICLIFLPVAALNLSGCAEIQSRGKIIKDVIYAREVPASFETSLICIVDERIGSSLQFKWFSDNGTLKGDGKNMIKLIKRGQIGCNPLEFRTKEGLDHVIDKTKRM